MSDVEISLAYNEGMTRDALRVKLDEFPSNSTVRVTNIPENKIKGLRMNLTLSGYIGVKINGNEVTANTPKVRLMDLMNIVNVYFTVPIGYSSEPDRKGDN